MDASLTIRFEADPTHRFEAFDDAGEILLRGCLRPFPYPRQPGSPALVVNGQQLLKRTKPIRVDPFDERFIGLLAGASPGTEGNPFQFQSRRQDDTPLPKIGDHRADDCVAAIRASGLLDCNLRDNPIILTLEWTNSKICLQLAELFPAGFFASGVTNKSCEITAKLASNKTKHIRGRDFRAAPHTTGKTEIGEKYGKPKPVCIAPSSPNQRQVLG